MKRLGSFFAKLLGGKSQASPQSATSLEATIYVNTKRPNTKLSRVNIGLDFGTSASKVIARFDDQKFSRNPFYILPPNDAQDTVLFPSTIAYSNHCLIFGKQAEETQCSEELKVRSFKMNIPSEIDNANASWRRSFKLGDTGLTASDASTLYLAWVLRIAKVQISKLLGSIPLDLTINCAAPLDQLQSDQKLMNRFHQIVYQAYLLSDQACQNWDITNALKALRQVKTHPIPEKTESIVTILPETHAAMTAFMLIPGQERGLYCSVDIGAGTSDVSFFWLHFEDSQPEACYYGTLSEFVGIDDIDQVLGGARGLTAGQARKLREAKQLAIEDCDVSAVVNKLYGVYKKAFGFAYEHNCGESLWVDKKNKHSKYTICLLGGGATFQSISKQFGISLPHFGIAHTPVTRPRVPNDLSVIVGSQQLKKISEIASAQQPLLLLAYGLAHRAVDIPLWDPNAQFSKTYKKIDAITHEEKYAK